MATLQINRIYIRHELRRVYGINPFLANNPILCPLKKHQKIFGFLVFSGGIKREHLPEMETDNYEGMPKIQKQKQNFKCDFLYCVYKFTYSVPMIIFRALHNMLELFYETFYRLKAVKYFCQVDPLLVFDRVLNTTLGFRSGNVCKAVKNKNFYLQKFSRKSS